jgi:chromosome segregation ATPase
MNYKKIIDEIKTLEQEIENERDRLDETRGRIERDQGIIDRLAESFKEAVLSGDEKGIRQLETEAQKAQTQIKRDRVLADGLTDVIVQLEIKLAGFKEEASTILCQNAQKWLSAEKEAFDKAAKEMLIRRQRLLQCHQILRDGGKSEVYREEVPSPVFETLPLLNILLFGIVPSMEGIKDQVLQELEK